MGRIWVYWMGIKESIEEVCKWIPVNKRRAALLFRWLNSWPWKPAPVKGCFHTTEPWGPVLPWVAFRRQANHFYVIGRSPFYFFFQVLFNIKKGYPCIGTALVMRQIGTGFTVVRNPLRGYKIYFNKKLRETVIYDRCFIFKFLKQGFIFEKSSRLLPCLPCSSFCRCFASVRSPSESSPSSCMLGYWWMVSQERVCFRRGF